MQGGDPGVQRNHPFKPELARHTVSSNNHEHLATCELIFLNVLHALNMILISRSMCAWI